MTGHTVQSFGEVATDETAHRTRPYRGGCGGAHAGDLVGREASVQHAVPVEVLRPYVAVVDVGSVDTAEGCHHHQSGWRDGDVVDAALVVLVGDDIVHIETVAAYAFHEEETLSPTANPNAT